MATATVKPDVSPAQHVGCSGKKDRHVFVVCTGEECVHAGSERLLEDLKHECKHSKSDVRVGASRCLGHCQLAPAVMEDGKMLGWVSQKRLHSELSRLGIIDS